MGGLAVEIRGVVKLSNAGGEKIYLKNYFKVSDVVSFLHTGSCALVFASATTNE